MASYQIEIASAPFDHVLRDHNRRIRDRDRERFTFQKNIDELVRDHFNNCWGSSGNEEGNRNSPNFGLMSSHRGDDEMESEEMRRQQTRILDRWAARQAREMITTIERQTHEAELMALSNSQSVSERASTFLRETSPSQSDASADVPNLRASSLVQMWKEFEAEAITPRANQTGNSNNNTNSNVRYRRLNSTASNNENSSVGESPMGSDRDVRFDNVEAPEDSFMEWGSGTEQTASREQHCPTYQRQCSDASEGGRVADLVKRLTSGSQTAESSLNSSYSCNENENDREQTVVLSLEHSVYDQGDQIDLKLGRKRLRVRGRQAMKDLLVQMEQERHRELGKLAECHAVSLFQHRGRIQSLLRLKFLQRDIAVHDRQQPASRASELKRMHGRSSILHLRERFSTRAKEDGNAPVQNEDKLQSHTQLQIATPDSGDMPGQNEYNLQTDTQLGTAIEDLGNVPSLLEDNMQNGTQPLKVTGDLGQSDIYDHLTSQSVNQHDVQKFGDSELTVTVTHSMPSTSEHNGQTECHSLASTSDHIQESSCVILDVTQKGLYIDNLDSEGPTNTERTANGLQGDTVTEEAKLNTMHHTESMASWEMLTDEPDSSTLNLMESTDGSWLNDVYCPPRSWESRRQTWYDDMLENDSDNEEIHALLERRTVSALLASSFRQRMDRIILSHMQRHPEIYGDVEQEEVILHHYQEVSDDPDQVASPSMQLPLPSSQLRPWSQYQDQEVSDDPDQVASPSLQLPLPSSQLRPWSQYRDQEVTNDYDQAAYTSLRRPQPSSSDYQDSQQCSPFTNPSLEMELLYDLKGHIERLQYEMSELRESVKSCVGMQVNLQNTIKQEVAAAVCRSMTAVRGEEREFSNSSPKEKGTCCICCSMQVDALLYRCGHMCACYKCAQELQWSGSKCPICRAPILDVVRAYSDS